MVMAPISKLLYATFAFFNGVSNANHAHAEHGQAHPDNAAPVEVGKSLWHDIVKYTHYASASYQGPDCPHPPFESKLYRFIDVNVTTTQAVIYKNKHNKEFVIAFPGTRGHVDQSIDADASLTTLDIPPVSSDDCLKCTAHDGFQHAWRSVHEHVFHTIHEIRTQFKDYKITLVGHSLGGAIASLATTSLRNSGVPIHATYTFGQPRTGNQEYANFVDKLNHVHKGSKGHFHRVTHASDGVPQWPSRDYGYQHHSTEYWEKNVKPTPKGSKYHVEARTVTYRCFGQEPDNCNNSKHPRTITDPAHRLYTNLIMGSKKTCEKKSKT